jgi:uncharacterized glyoxalase superfamily protein PhnB
MAEAGPTFRSAVIYQDDRRAIEWLQKAFGFEIAFIVTDDSGKIGHAEMKFGNGLVFIASEWSDVTRSPKSLGAKNTQFLHVHMEADLDAHCERARKAGATITQEPADQFYGDRTYRCLDHEGHLWTFGQTVKRLTLEEVEKASGLKLKHSDKL